MARPMRFLLLAIILPILAILLLAASTNAAERTRNDYRVPLTTAAGGPVRATQAPGMRDFLQIRSTPELNEQKQSRLAWHFRNAASLAERFAAKEGLSLARTTVPCGVEIYSNTDELSDATQLPGSEYGWRVVARMDLNRGVVYLGRKNVDDLYVELGKWYFYPANYRWGYDRRNDMAMLQTAERFARFCMDKKNWTEADGNMKSVW